MILKDDQYKQMVELRNRLKQEEKERKRSSDKPYKPESNDTKHNNGASSQPVSVRNNR